MILKKHLFVLALVTGLAGCTHSGEHVNKPVPMDVPDIALDLHFRRMELDLYPPKKTFDSTDVKQLRLRYGKFFDLWLLRLAGILPPYKVHAPDATIAQNLNQYMSDRYIKEVFQQCVVKFKDVHALEHDLSAAFKRYIKLFPGKSIPTLITYVSPFTSNVTATDSSLGLGLHFYLGSDYKYYSTLGLPQYMIRRFRPEYMLTDLLQGWLDSEYMNDSMQHNCLNQMIYKGKILYAAEVLSPETADTILIGYSRNEAAWVEQNEMKIWTFLIEQKLLYATNPKEYIRFINDGNGTSGFPAGAPAKLGVYIGWQIVRSFMLDNPDITLQQLMQINNAQLILGRSGYKPPKNS